MKPAIPGFLHTRGMSRDLLAVLLLALIVFGVSARFDIFDWVLGWLSRHDTWELHEIFTVTIFLVIAFPVYAWRRNRELKEQIRRRERAEAEKALLVPELENALADVSKLKKLFPICSRCMKIRDTTGYWVQVDQFMEVHYHTRLDGGLCPDCARRIYGNGRKPGESEAS